jgi:hypothetical protein
VKESVEAGCETAEDTQILRLGQHGFCDSATLASWTIAETTLGKNDLRRAEKTAIPL